MTTNSDRASARIFQFPARGRFATGSPIATGGSIATGGPVATGGPSGAAKLPANAVLSTRVAKVAAGGAWYHDEAIRESERASNS